MPKLLIEEGVTTIPRGSTREVKFLSRKRNLSYINGEDKEIVWSIMKIIVNISL